MILLAATEGNLVFLIVAAIVGVINWLMEKNKKASGSGPTQAPPAPRQTPANPGSDEQERLRRFMESLGVPQPPQRPAQAQRPHPVAHPTAKPAQQIPQRVAQPIKGRMPSSRATAQTSAKVIRPPKRIVLQEQDEFARAGRIEAAASSIEKISGEFESMNVRVTMDPLTTPDRPAHLGIGNAGTTSVLERDGSPIAAKLRKLLHNPTDLRAAFVAMEVLGTPRGLQN